MTQFRNISEVQNINDASQLFCTQVYTATLAATTDTSLTVPGGANMGNLPATTYNKMIAVIKCTAGKDVWVALNATAAVPAGASFAASTSELVNGYYELIKQVEVADVLHFYCGAAAASVSVSFYRLSGY